MEATSPLCGLFLEMSISFCVTETTSAIKSHKLVSTPLPTLKIPQAFFSAARTCAFATSST
jgi:hypothetical protein